MRGGISRRKMVMVLAVLSTHETGVSGFATPLVVQPQFAPGSYARAPCTLGGGAHTMKLRRRRALRPIHCKWSHGLAMPPAAHCAPCCATYVVLRTPHVPACAQWLSHLEVLCSRQLMRKHPRGRHAA